MSLCPCIGEDCTLSVNDPRHGTVTGNINHKCRCADCEGARREYKRRWTQDRPNLKVVKHAEEPAHVPYRVHKAVVAEKDAEIARLKRQLVNFQVRF